MADSLRVAGYGLRVTGCGVKTLKTCSGYAGFKGGVEARHCHRNPHYAFKFLVFPRNPQPATRNCHTTNSKKFVGGIRKIYKMTVEKKHHLCYI